MQAFPGAEIVGIRSLPQAAAPEGSATEPEDEDDED
jgi:hypothetical protein